MNFNEPDYLDIYLWDVGHGLSITVFTPHVTKGLINRRRIIQIDAGSNNETNFFPIKHLVENRGVNTIDHLIISHPDLDHINDLANVKELMDKGKLQVISFTRNRTIPQSEISEDAGDECEAKSHYRYLHENYIHQLQDEHILTPENFGGLSAQIVHLDYDPNLDVNDASIIVSLCFGNTQIIIPGDISDAGVTRMIERDLMPKPIDNGVRILIAPHHGRESAEADNLVSFYKPKIVLASAKTGDEHTDSFYSNSTDVFGYPIHDQNFENPVSYKFRGTKGQAMHVFIPMGVSPLLRRIPYDY
ncbi:MAG: hypothetical protein WCW56_03040 [Candidatus Paceibacterota bacterium]|jgi:competence protein ComEC